MNISLYNERIRINYDPDDVPAFYKISALPEKQMQEPGIIFAPYSPQVFEQLQKWRFNPSVELIEYARKERERKENFHVSGLNGELRPFQNRGVSFMQENNGRCLLSDDQGIGKTIQAIGFIHVSQKLPAVIICPASIKVNWQREIEKWTGMQSEILKGTKPYKTEGDILIINYDIASFWTDEIKRRNPQILILDELTRIKTARTNRTKAIFRLKNIPHIIGLSGTPIENRPAEIYNAGKLIRPELFGTFAEFKRKYCNGNGFGHEFEGTADTHLLNFMLTSTGFMLRRLKKDILTELPEKTFSFVPMELNNWREYREAESNFIEWVRREKGVIIEKQVEALAKFENLKQLATKGKLKQVKEWIRVFLETDNKLVVFCTHKFVVAELMAEFSDCAVKIDGSTNDRQTPVDKFQNDPKTRLFIGNVISAGEGITLTASSNVAMIELPWSPSKIDQAGDRVHRIGQKDAVTVYYLLAQNTVEERIAKLLDKKRKMVNSVMNGTKTEQSELLVELINSYKN